MFEIKNAIGAHGAFRKIIEGAVVKDVAVLIDLDKRDAFVLRGRFNHRAKMFDVDVDRACDESRLASDRKRERVDRIVDRSQRR